MISIIGVKMKLRIVMKKYAVDWAESFPKKIDFRTNGLQRDQPPAWELNKN